MGLLSDHSSAAAEDRDRFVRALAYNFVIGGTDAHAKNYALLLMPNQVRLAPFYDIASYLPYMGKEKGVKLAMKIGGKYEMDEIMPSHWERLADGAGFDKERALAHVRDIIFRLPGEALSLLYQCRVDGLKSEHLSKLADELWARAKTLAAIYGAEQMANS
jgi:serine/threonine-protein kinase HipA